MSASGSDPFAPILIRLQRIEESLVNLATDNANFRNDIRNHLIRQASPDRWLSLKEAAAHIGVGDDKVRELRANGELHATNLGSAKPNGQRWFFRKSDLDDFMANRI